MKFSVSRGVLSDALRKVQGLASGKQSMPILGSVLINAKGQEVTFTTTDLDLSLIVGIPCNVQEEGAVALPAKLLSDAVARSADGDVSIEVDEKTAKAVILAGTSTFKLNGIPATEFPTLPKEDEDVQTFNIPQEVLKSLIRRTVFAVSKDDTRRTLKGELFKFAEGKLVVVATDGRRLACAEYEPATPYGFDLEFILPDKSIIEVNKNLGNSGDASFSMCKSQIVIQIEGGVTIYSKLIEDTYPNWTAVIPQNNDKEIKIDRIALIEAIDRVGVFAEAGSMQFEFSNNMLSLSSALNELGDSHEPVPVKYEGEEIKTTFNHGYVLDVLKSLDDDEISLFFSSGSAPVLIKSSMPGLSIIMPLRIQ